MESNEYEIMYANEDVHWWFQGTRTVILDYSRMSGSQSEESVPKVLDVGCGTGATLVALAEVADVTGIELDAGAVAFCRERGLEQVVEGSAESLPFSDGAFDMVFALDVIEHLDDDEAGLREFLRVLKPGGKLVVTVPAYQFLWSQHDEALHHRRRYTRPQLLRALQSAEFHIDRASYYNTLLFPLVAGVRLMQRLVGTNGPAKSDVSLPPRWLNGLLYTLLASERFALRGFRLPFGVSLIAIASKAGKGDK